MSAFISRFLPSKYGNGISHYAQPVRVLSVETALAVGITICCPATPAKASIEAVSREQAARAAIHPVATTTELNSWLARVPGTRDWPPDFAETLRDQAPVLVIEMSTAPGCLPCADLWNRLSALGGRYGWRLRAIDEREAMIRSGRLGLPWIGHPVAWVRPGADSMRTIPIAIGTDREANLARNMYLAAKMMAGVRPDVGVRGMAKFTGIVGAPARPRGSAR